MQYAIAPVPAILTEAEAAEFLRIGLTKIRELRKAGRIPHLADLPIRYLSESLFAWVREQEVPVKTDLSGTASSRNTRYNLGTDKAALRAGILA